MTSDAHRAAEQDVPRPARRVDARLHACACARALRVRRRDHPVNAHVGRDLLDQPIDQSPGRTCSGTGRTRPPLLRMAAGKRLRLDMVELAPQRFVLRLAAWMILPCSFLRSSCIRPSAERAAPSSVASICAHARRQLRHPLLQQRRAASCSAASTPGGSCASSSWFSARFVLRLQLLERQVVAQSGSARRWNRAASRSRADTSAASGRRRRRRRRAAGRDMRARSARRRNRRWGRACPARSGAAERSG